MKEQHIHVLRPNCELISIISSCVNYMIELLDYRKKNIFVMKPSPQDVTVTIIIP